MFLLTFTASKIGSFFSKSLALFLMFYLGIALLDISNYRGEIYIETLKVYSAAVLCMLFFVIVFNMTLKNNVGVVHQLGRFSKKQYVFIVLHLIIVYLSLFYIYISKGNILLNQDLRFHISPAIGYIIKSSIYIPLIYWATRQHKSKLDILSFVCIPLLPALLIGSRGTVIMIMLGMLIIQFVQSKELEREGESYRVYFNKGIILKSGLIGLFFIYGLYYIRRLSSSSNFLTPSEALNEYFYSDSWLGYLVMPLHLAFKETFGLTNRIISDGLTNTFTDVPLFIADLITILPGKQVGAGEAMAHAFGTVAAGGLTPGIVGGLYIDFGMASILILLGIVGAIRFTEFKAQFNDRWLVIFALSFIQFIHLFHRGFVKPEYIFAYFIIIFYLSLSPAYKVGSK
jgi:oligosaccharide repeat unit polymerase